MKKSIISKIIWIASLLILISGSMFSQSTANLSGKVTDSSTGEGLPFANIALEGTNLGGVSDRYGNFTISRIPFGTYNVVVRYIGYENYNTSVTLNASNTSAAIEVPLISVGYELEDVVVVSVLQGQRKALNQQLNADEIKNVMSREEMEKFPDMNTAEVLQRMPGVNIDRSQGEGRFVYIRGTDPRLTSVTVDGQKLATTEDASRVTDLGIINATQLSSIEVSKSLTPEMDASGIGGQVNLVTRSPFDYLKPRLTLEAGGGYSPQGKEPQYRFSGSYVGFLGKEKKFGYTASGSYNQTNINGQRIDMSYGTINTVNRVELPFHLSEMRLQNRESKRERYGASGILSYKPNNNNSFYLRGMYNQYNNDLVLSDIYFRMQGALWFDSTNLRNGRMDYSNIHEPKTSKLATYAIGGKHEWGAIKVDYDLNYSSGAERTPEGNERVRSEWTIATRPNFALDWSDTDYPVFTMTSTDRPANFIFDPLNYRIDTQELKDIQNSNTNIAGTINASLAYNLLGISGELKSGFKYAMDEKSRTGVTTRYTWQGAGVPRMNLVASDDTIPDFLGDRYNFAPMINIDSARALIDKWADQNPGLRNDVGGSAIWVSGDGVGGVYTNNEKIYSFYLMTNMNFGRFVVIAGFRDEYTATDYNGKNILFDSRGDVSSVEPAIAKTNYNNIFPHLHLKYKLGMATNIRASANQSIARPNYYDLAPYYFFDPQERRLITGNPDLAPTYSTNYDLMFEHYFKGIGVASIGFFYKDINDLIYTQTSTDTTGELAGFTISTPQNAGSALLYGFELNWQQQFTFLPGFLNGFGIYGNYTFTKSEANLDFREWTVIPGQAGDVGNIGLSYEKYGLTARLSLNYRSVVLDGIGQTQEYDYYSDESTRIDFTSIYEFSKRLSVYLNLMNLTNTIDRDYLGKYSRPTSIEYYGFSGTLGFRVNL